MKTSLKLALGLSVGLLVSIGSALAATQSYTYKNQRGSVMTLNWSEGKEVGTLSGTFKTAVSKCEMAHGKEIPITGSYNGNAVAIIANYPGCGSVIAMSGNLNKDKSEMHLHWFVTRQAKDTLHESWDTTAIGVDQYKKQ